MNMDIHTKPNDQREFPSPVHSQHSNCSSNCAGCSSSNHNSSIMNNGGVQIQSPKPISRSEANPYPTTFVQADTSNFKQVVQMLTGSSDTAKQASKPNHQDPPSAKNHMIPPVKTAASKKQQQGYKLYERRNQLKNNLMINTFMPGYAQAHAHAHHHPHIASGFSPRNHFPEILSPSMLDFPKLTLSSPVTPLNIEDPFNRSSPSLGTSSSSEEDKAIAEKGFYLHPSPRTATPRDSEPQLLPLFPLESPRLSGSSS